MDQDILDIVIKRMDKFGESDQVSFQKWLENVLLASTRGTNQETVREIIEMIRNGKGGSKMIHGIQVIIQGEYNRGIADGEVKGKSKTLISLVCKKLAKGKSPEAIAEELEENLSVVSPIIETARKYAPDYDEELIYQELAAENVPEHISESEA